MVQVSPLYATNYTVYSKLIPENIVKESYFMLIPSAVSKQPFKKKSQSRSINERNTLSILLQPQICFSETEYTCS